MIKTTTRTTDIVLCGMFVALMAVGAFIKIMLPLGLFQVTFSLQFFFALLAGFLLGAERGCMSVIVYLITGLIGIPIFAHGGGIGYLLKPTFGFLIGFAAAAAVCGYVAKKMGASGFWTYLFAAFCGEMVYYACGLIYYFFMFNFVVGRDVGIGLAELMSVWFLSTVIPDFVLCVMAAMVTGRLKVVFGR